MSSTTPPPVPDPILPEPAPEPDPVPPTTPPNPWIARAVATALLVGTAAAYLLFGHAPGAGLAVFTLAAVAAIVLNRDTGLKPSTRHTAVLGALVVATAVQAVLRPSPTNALIAFLLATYTAALVLLPRTPTAVLTLLEGAAKLVAAPLRPFQSLGHTGTVTRALRDTAAPVVQRARAGRRTAAAVLPAAVVATVFLFLLAGGNGILGHALSTAFADLADAFRDITFPSPARVAFAAAVAVATLALLWRGNPSRALAYTADLCKKTFASPADPSLARLRTVLILAAVNAVFFVANTIDAVYLWAGAGLPEHLKLSEFVHQGTSNLIVSVLAAAAVLSALFQQHHDVTGNRQARALAVAWIAQNLFLTTSVALRLHDYVDNYGLSLLRLYLLLFLVLTAVGFVLLAVRVVREKSFAWLVAANLTATVVMLTATQFVDLRETIARTNFTLAQVWKETHVNHRHIDTAQLADLGPSAWPTLVEIASSEPVEGDAHGFARYEIANARRHLRQIAAEHLGADTHTGWQSFSLHRETTLAALRDYDAASRATASATAVK